MMAPLIVYTLLVTTKDRPEELLQCLRAAIVQNPPPHTVLIVDDGNLDEDKLRSDLGPQSPPVAVVRKEIKGSVASLNHGGSLIETPWFLVLDDDIYLEPDCVTAMQEALQATNTDTDRIGAVAGYPLLAGRHWSLRAIVRLWLERLFLLNGYRELCLLPSTYFTICESGWNPGRPYPVDFIPGGLALWRTDAFKALQYDPWFIEEYAHAADLELSIRLKKNWELVGVPAARGLHVKSPRSRTPMASLGEMKVRNQRYIFRKHFSGSPIRWVCFHWALFGQVLLLAAAALTAPSQQSGRWSEVSGMIRALLGIAPSRRTT